MHIAPTKDVVEDYPGPGTGSVQFTVDGGQDANAIGSKLVEAGVVRSQAAFTQAVMSSEAGGKLLPGTFTLKRQMKASQVVDILTDPSQAGGFLEVKAGQRASDVIKRAVSISGLSQKQFDAALKEVLPGEADGSIEGWFEPGRYAVKDKRSAKAILKSMVDARVAKLDDLGVPTGAARQRVVTVASIVEGEVNKSEYYPKVSRVMDNRLKRNMPLGMDSVVAYGNGVSPRQVTNAMINDASNPYNSRKHTGLPPTPIGNAGDAAIQAALHPADGDWLYFVTVNLDTGETKFTASESQFQQYVKEYQRWEASH